MKSLKMLFVIATLIPLFNSVNAQYECEPEWSVYDFSTTNGFAEGQSNTNKSSFNVLNTAVGSTDLYINETSPGWGFWTYYETEPFAPRVTATDGDHDDRIEVTWEIMEDDQGSPVTGTLAKLFRNGTLLTTVPVEQTSYQDYNVFPGEFYEYEVVVDNDYGDSYTEGDVGFLNPNGLILGKVRTPNLVPVPNVEVRLTPNLGRALQFNGTSDFVVFDTLTTLPIDSQYTVEGWFRAFPDASVQTFITLTDIGTQSGDQYVWVGLNASGQVSYTHSAVAGDASPAELHSIDTYNDLEWHHFAATHSSLEMSLFVDGNLIDTASEMNPILSSANIGMGKFTPQDDSGYLHGRLDDIRFWSVAREREDIRFNDQRTMNGEEAGLVAYWKFDEVLGTKIFDLTNNDYDGVICSVTRTDQKAPVWVSGLTDEDGNYSIKGIYYGAGTTFDVTPVKETPIGRALQFDGIDDYLQFDFKRLDFSAGYTIEGWFKTAGGQDQTLLSTVNPADGTIRTQIQMLADGSIGFTHNSSSSIDLNSGTIYDDEIWHHVAATHDGVAVTLYVDAVPVATTPEANFISELQEFVVGRSAPDVSSSYYFGMLDEFRVWDYGRIETQVSGTMMQALVGDESGLQSYWNLNEGSGEVIEDLTSNSNAGVLMNPQDESWIEDIPLNEYFTHIFDIESRQAILNPSNTAVDRVDFTDISQIAISGFVRFENTDCFAGGVEILVDGESKFPPIVTDASGKYIAEFEPGRTGAILTPVLNDHTFVPPFIELPTINKPITGITFYDQKTFNLSGKVVGGSCEFPITPSQGQIEVTITSVSGCLEITTIPDLISGEFLVEDLPPQIYNVSVDHPNPAIDAFFTGDTVSLENGHNSISFVYKASPEVLVTGFPTNDCGLRVMEELVDATIEIHIFESYFNNGDTNICAVDSGSILIVDEMGDAGETELNFTDGFTTYTIPGGGYPNILGGGDYPYQKNLQVVATNTATNESVSTTEWAYILGNRPRASVFTTSSPEIPIMILRDPPGDESYSFIDQETSTSTSFSMGINTGVGVESYAAVHLGADVTVSAGAWGIPDIDLETTMDITAAMSLNVSAGAYSEQTWSLSTTEIFQTSDDNAVVGDGGDVFIGGAMNIAYGVTDILEIDEGCNPIISQEIIMAPNGFETTYIYSESHIVGSVIPSLWTIGDTTAAELWQQIIDQNDELKAAAIFRQNYSFDGAAGAFEYSETEETSSSFSLEFEMEIESSVQVEVGATLLGVGASGGVKIGSRLTMGTSTTTETTNTNTVGYVLSDGDPGDFFSVDVLWDGAYGTPVFNTVSGASSCPWESNTAPREGTQLMADQTIAIDIPPDEPAVFSLLLGNTSQSEEDGYFLIQILQDTNPNGAHFAINGTDFEEDFPIFLLAGQSTPVTMTIDRGPEEYVYEDMIVRIVSECEFDLWQDRGDATAPIPLSDSLTFSVEYSVPCSEVNIAVPEDNWLVIGGEEDSLWVTLDGYDNADANLTHIELQYRQVLDAATTNQRAIELITEELISQKGAQKMGPFLGDALPIPALQADGRDIIHGRSQVNKTPATELLLKGVKDFGETTTHNFQLPINASGELVVLDNSIRENDWFVAVSIPIDSLLESFYLVPWNISPEIILDGTYEIRASAVCEAGLVPGRSEILTGVIDRTGPLVVGAPTPVDGILGPDDQIIITLNENIDCGAINIGAGDILLFNTVTGNPVDFSYTCGANVISIEPNIQNHFIENQTLRAEVHNLQDVYGNPRLESIEWEFYVNRNPIEWVGSDISNIVIYDDESFMTTRQLVNNGGSNRAFELTNIPSWIDVSPLSGNLTPGSMQTITFELSDQPGAGEYVENIYASGTMGDEPMLIDIRVLCYEPYWELTAESFQYSMNIIATLSVDGELSDDVYDRVGVFAGGELRGVADVEYVPTLDDLGGPHPYEVFLTIYSNEIQGEELSMRIWDATECTELGMVVESFTFEANSILGSPTSPASITATNQIIQQLDYPVGWTWFSLNLENDDMSVNSVLENLNPSSGDLIKSQTSFNQYVETHGWVGTLDSLTNRSMYQIRLEESDTLEMVGYAVNVELDTIPVASGWNWISYMPQTSMVVDIALQSLEAISGDVIKSQFTFAMYVEGLGWIGSMQFMNPRLGYLLYSYNGGELVYPELQDNDPPALLAKTTENDQTQGNEIFIQVEDVPDWTVDAHDYEHNLTITALIDPTLIATVDTLDIVAAFVGEECRGVSQPVFIEALDQYMVFLMVYGNSEDEDVTFSYYDASEDYIWTMETSITFQANLVLGSVNEPLVMTLQTLGIGDPGYIPDSYSLAQNYPNPFNPVTTLGFGLPEEGHVSIRIYNLRGQAIRTLIDKDMQAGYEFVEWNSLDDGGRPMTSGIYLVVMQSGNFREVRKMLMLK
ncbi:MAG: T9SS type A sorting domain-containing protein [Candidatus Marinimicrobia bacterium]|nr:T9SS type A sorting domain-containing protein [Candidatus Neomarinimicrobiota bacterium]